MKKGTIREIVSKLIYDPNIDPADYSVVFKDSSILRRVPFTYLEFADDGFYYFGNFYPLYKIMAIIRDRDGEYLLKRNIFGIRIIGDKGLEFPDYPMDLRAIYDDFSLHRYASQLLFSLRSRLEEKDFLEWFRILGEFKVFNYSNYTVYIITDPGPFRGVTLFVSSNKRILLRSIPTPLNIDDVRDKINNHKACFQRILGDIEHIFLLEHNCVRIKNYLTIKQCSKWQEELVNRLDRNFSIFIDKKGDQKHLLDICDQSDFLFLDSESEIELARVIGIDSSMDLNNCTRLRNATLNPNTLIKIHDKDIIFAMKRSGSVSRGANLIP